MERLKERVAHIGQYAVTLLKWQLSSSWKTDPRIPDYNQKGRAIAERQLPDLLL